MRWLPSFGFVPPSTTCTIILAAWLVACGETPTPPPTPTQPANQAPVAVGSIPALELATGDTLTLSVAQFFNDPDGDALTYSAAVSDSAVARASVADSVVTIRARERGTAALTVTASDGDLSVAQRTGLEVYLSGTAAMVVISPDRPRIFGPHEEAPFDAVAFDENGRELTRASIEWVSSAPTVATVSPDGMVTTVAQGSAIVTARTGDASATAPIVVGPSQLRLEYAALRVMFDALEGPGWARKENWATHRALDSWSGVTIDSVGYVTALQLGQNNLAGTLPPEIGTFKRLRRLDLDLNFGINGAIPPEIGDLESIEWLKLSSTSLSGPVPAAIGRLSTLTGLEVHFTQLTSIPPEIGDLTELVVLNGYQSKFEGPLPAEIGDLKKVTQLWLNGNRFSGTIPPEIGDMTSLERLHLHENTFTGPIPPALGRAANLTALRLSDNRLAGELPADLARATELRWLALDGNRLSGPLPAVLGGMVNLEILEVQANDFSGPIPPAFGDMQQLRQLSASNNPGLTGPLPVELTQLRALQKLLLGGTELCAPTDAQFLAWLRAVGATFVSRCVRNVGSDAYLTQAVQSREYPVPLIAGDSALLRVFVVSEKAAAAGVRMPPARATFYQGESEVYAVDLPGTSATVPAAVDESDLGLSLNVLIPGPVLQPGLAMVVEIDPDGTLDPALGVDARLPESGKTRLEIEAVPTYEVTFITFLWTEQPDSALLAKVDGLTPDSPLLWATREFLPVHEMNVVHREPIWMDDNPSPDIMLPIIWATHAARQAEGGRGHWVGVWSGCCGGAGYDIQTAGVGLEPAGPDRFWQNNNVLAHELGHLMTLPHAPCNVGDPDPDFPYPAGNIGSWGFDSRVGELRPPDSPEFMGYCGEREKWISGFYHSQALGWRLRWNEPRTPPAARTRSLMVWGGVQPDGVLTLEPAFVLDAVPTRHIRPGPYMVTGRDSRDTELFSHPLAMGSLAHGGGAFALMIPVQPEWETKLDRIGLVGPEGRTQVRRDGATASVLLTDPATGQIRGFLRRGAQIAVAASVRDEVLGALLPEPGLAVHLSRGIPAPEDLRPLTPAEPSLWHSR